MTKLDRCARVAAPLAGALLAALMAAAPVDAAEAPLAASPLKAPTAAAAAAAAAPAPAALRTNPFGSAPLPAALLATKRGGDRVVNDTQLTGAVSGNQAVNVTTGANLIGDGAFAGSTGIATVIQNSGNNVLIQNAIVVNVQLK